VINSNVVKEAVTSLRMKRKWTRVPVGGPDVSSTLGQKKDVTTTNSCLRLPRDVQEVINSSAAKNERVKKAIVVRFSNLPESA
jgi:hypothetical protein